MPDGLLQYILELLNQIASPVVLGSGLEHYSQASVRCLIAEGILKETEAAEEIPRPARYGYGGDLVVRRTAIGLFGVADGDDFCEPVPLTEDDVRQYAISVPGLVEKLRKENGIVGNGFHVDRGVVAVGQKVVHGFGVVEVYISLPNNHPDLILGRLMRLENMGQKVALLTPAPLAQPTEHRRILAGCGVVVIPLMPVAESDALELDWQMALGVPAMFGAGESEAQGKRRPAARSIGSPEALKAVQKYMEERGWGITQFAGQVGTTDRTFRNFLKRGKMRRSSFETMAEQMGLSVEQLLRGELPQKSRSR